MVKYVWHIRSRVLVVQNHLAAIYTTLARKMTNFNNLEVQQNDFGEYALPLEAGLWTLDPLMKIFSTVALQNFWHIAHGIYMYVYISAPTFSCLSICTSSWEYVTNLDFELDVIWGRRSYRWTIWVCSYTRCFACRHLSVEIRANLPVR